MGMTFVEDTIQSTTSVKGENIDQQINGNLRTQNSAKKVALRKGAASLQRIVCSGI